MINTTIKEILYAVTTRRSDNFKHINNVSFKNIYRIKNHKTTNFAGDKFHYCNFCIRLDNEETLEFQIRKSTESITIKRIYNHQIVKLLIDIESHKLHDLFRYLMEK